MQARFLCYAPLGYSLRTFENDFVQVETPAKSKTTKIQLTFCL